MDYEGSIKKLQEEKDAQECLNQGYRAMVEVLKEDMDDKINKILEKCEKKVTQAL